MRFTKKRFFNFLIILAIIFSAFQIALTLNIDIVQAGSLWDMQEGIEDEIGDKAFGQRGAPRDIRVVIAGMVRAFLGMLGIVFTILVMAAGYMWMTAGGNEEQVSKAKSQLTRASIGLIIILISWFIATFAVGCLSDITSDNMFGDFCPGS